MQHQATQQQELADLIQKRTHGTMSKLEMERGTDLRVLGQTTKKQKKKPFQRKEIVDLHIDKSDVTMATTLEQLPGNRGSNSQHQVGILETDEKTVNRNARESKTKHTKVTETEINVLNRKDTSRVKTHTCAQNLNEHVEQKDLGKLLGASQSDKNHKFYLARRKQKSETSSDVMTCLNSSKKPDCETEPKTPYQTWDYYKNLKGGHVKTVFNKSGPGIEVKEKETWAGKQYRKETCDKNVLAHCETFEKQDTSKSDHAKKILHAFGSGWKKDWTGQWVKDEEAEFDTDEEAPDI